jgi:hypothetical protein
VSGGAAVRSDGTMARKYKPHVLFCSPQPTMIAHSQPIALPNVPNNRATQDYVMADVGSYTGSSSGTFNPASFTRHFLGSPISWRTGSYGLSSRIPAGSPTAHFLNSIEYVWIAYRTSQLLTVSKC